MEVKKRASFASYMKFGLVREIQRETNASLGECKEKTLRKSLISSTDDSSAGVYRVSSPANSSNVSTRLISSEVLRLGDEVQ